MNKKNLLVLLLASCFLLPSVALAFDLTTVMNNIIVQLEIVSIGLIVIMFMWAGLIYLTARGEPARVSKAHSMMIWGAVGTAVLILAEGMEALIKGILGL